MIRFCLFFLLIVPVTFAQAPPSKDIFLLDLSGSGEALVLGKPANITGRNGYDNQPGFTANNYILYTSIRDDGQADIYGYDLETGKTKRHTYTQESEYSPTLTPDGKHFSVIRVEFDGTQRLWAFPLEGGAPDMLSRNIKPVGYHTWLDDYRLGLFVLGQPNSLHLGNMKTDSSKTLVNNIGRGLKTIPGTNAISFIQIKADNQLWVARFDMDGIDPQDIIAAKPGSQDFCWTPDGMLLMGHGSVLYRFMPDSDKDWVEVANLAAHNIQNITRLAVSPNGKFLAVTADAPGQ